MFSIEEEDIAIPEHLRFNFTSFQDFGLLDGGGSFGNLNGESEGFMETENKFAQLSIQSPNDQGHTSGGMALDFSFPSEPSPFSAALHLPPPEPSQPSRPPFSDSPPVSSADEQPPPPVPTIQPIRHYQGQSTYAPLTGAKSGRTNSSPNPKPSPQAAFQSEFQLPGYPNAKARGHSQGQHQKPSANFVTPAHSPLNSPSTSFASPYPYSPNPNSPFVPQTPQSPFQQPSQFLSSAHQSQQGPNSNFQISQQQPLQSNAFVSIPFSPHTYQTLNQNSNASSSTTDMMGAYNAPTANTPNQFASTPNFPINFTATPLQQQPSFPHSSSIPITNNNSVECMIVENKSVASPTHSPYTSSNGRSNNNSASNSNPSIQSPFAQQQQQQLQQQHVNTQDGRQTPSSLLQGIHDAMQDCKMQLKNIMFIQKNLFLQPSITEWKNCYNLLGQLYQYVSHQNKLVEYVYQSVILEPFSLHNVFFLKQEIANQCTVIEYLSRDLKAMNSPDPSRVPGELIIIAQPFPEVVGKNKQLGPDVLQVKLYHYRDIMSVSPVVAELITSTGESHAKKNSTEQVMEGEKQGLDKVSATAKFPLKFNTGSRGALACLKFSVEVLFMGMSKPVVLTSSTTKPFVIITTDVSWEGSVELLMKNELFAANNSVHWTVMANVIQRYFYVALKLNPANPERYLSNRDFDYFHKKFFNGADYVTPKQFESFWLYFGKALQVLRSTRQINKLWQQGVIYAFMGKDEINDNILNSEPGTFLIRFSESCPGQLAIGYADLYGNVKHYLIEPNELKKKSVAEFLNETSIFTEVLQCVGFQYETKEPVFRKIQKEVVLGPFLTNATEAMHEVKPGYDPLVDPWTSIAPDGRKSIKTNTGAMKRNYSASDSKDSAGK